jgi:tripartite-type tricarboxylate transporter receptor subunit TctC
MTLSRRQLLAAATASAGTLFTPALRAQRLPANRPLSLVLPVAPGGTVDILARRLAPRLSEVLGHPVVVDNRGGGAGVIAGSLVASAVPDGTSVLLGALDLATVPALLAQKSFVPMQHLAPVGLVSAGRLVLVINPERTPVRTLAELVALAKSQPGAMTFGSAGNGNVTHLFGEMFRQAAGIDLRHVPYRGTGPAMTDLLAGQITLLMAGPASVKASVTTGKLRALALTGREPGVAAGLGEVPTFTELGLAMPDTDMGAWQGLFVAKDTPKDTVIQLNQALNTVLAEPEMQAFMASIAVAPMPGTPEALGALLASQTRAWTQVIRQAGIVPG